MNVVEFWIDGWDFPTFKWPIPTVPCVDDIVHHQGKTWKVCRREFVLAGYHTVVKVWIKED